MNETARNARSSASTTNPNMLKEESMNSADVSAVSAAAGSSASTNPSPTNPKQETVGTPESETAIAGSSGSPQGSPSGKEVKPQDAGAGSTKVAAPQTDPPAPSKKKRKQPEPFNPAAIRKRAAAMVGRAKGMTDPVILADVHEVEARSTALGQVGAHVVAATLQVPTATALVAQHDVHLDVALALMGTALRKHGSAGAQIYRQSTGSDLYSRATTLLGRIHEAKAAIPLGLMHGLEAAVRAAAPAVKVRDGALQELEDAKESYRTARRELTKAIRLLQVSLSAHHAQARRAMLAPIPVVKGSKRAA